MPDLVRVSTPLTFKPLLPSDLWRVISPQIEQLARPDSVSMPTYSYRARQLRRIERRLESLVPLFPIKAARRLYLFYISLHDQITSKRYLERHPIFPVYQKHDYVLHANSQFPGVDSDHKRLLRVTTTEFRRLVDMFGNDEVFIPRGNKPMAPAKLQLAVLLNRMAHGESVPTIARQFNLSGRFPFPAALI